jgi:DNA-directed RNA polymerase specialized sigma24 family protein
MRRIATNVARDHVRAERPHASWTTTDNQIPASASSDGDLGEAVALAFRKLSSSDSSTRRWGSPDGPSVPSGRGLPSEPQP